jgi:hypothetical protein
MTKREAPFTGTEIDTSDVGGTAMNVGIDTGIVALVIAMFAAAIMFVRKGASILELTDEDDDDGVEVSLS